VLLVFLGLFVFLLSLTAVSIQFRRGAGILNKLLVLAIVLSALVFPSWAGAQVTTPDQISPEVQNSPTVSAPNSPAAASPNETPETAALPAPSAEPASERPVSWKLLFHNVMSDQKHIWTFPARLVQGQSLVPTAAVLGTTAGLVLLDPTESRYFRNTTTFNGFRTVFNGNATAIGMGAVPASLYIIGRFRKDSKMQHTALLAGEALADIAIVQTALKDIGRRVKPSRYPASGWFQSQGSPTSYLRGNGSFPSGHSMAAFAVATVVARRYGNHRWVPYVAYGLASVVGFSRLTLDVHFLSDIFMGGALGYSISRFTVLRQ
jgi:membrane-associated phospholipid phosphatase